MNRDLQQLSLRPISPTESGEQVRSVNLPIDQQFFIGRSTEANWPIPDPSVSRKHASIVLKDETWLVSDLASRHGTSVNGRSLEPNKPIPIQDGDVLTLGTWQCRCVAGFARHGMTTPFAPPIDNAASVSAIPAQQLGGVAQRGLDVIMDLTAKLDELDTRESVANAAATAVREATGCRRVVIVEPETENEYSILASTSEKAVQVSRSLIEQAVRQGLVQLTVTPDQTDQARSILDLGIRSAICAPINVDGLPSAFVTIDTRDAEGVVPQDAASFCQSVARLVGLSFQRISAAVMADRHRQLKADLDAARRAQELLSPPKRGKHGAVAYRFESIPGRVVAGDLFDIFPLDEGRTAFFLGDVSGKGVGAAMLMASCQSQLRTQLLSGTELATAMTLVNADLHQRSEASKFITLLAGVIDVDRHDVEIVDAGHGLIVYAPAQGAATQIKSTPGFPLGVVGSAEYEASRLNLEAGASLVLFSDGAVEQTDPSGNQYGFEGVLECLAGTSLQNERIDLMLNGVRSHAKGPLADDLTVAAVWVE